jgi:ferredoxin
LAQARESSTATLDVPCGAHAVIHEEGGAFLVRDGQVVLDAALEQGCALDHGCRAGSCGACAVEVVNGLANVEAPDPIEADALDRFRLGSDVRLACRMRARGPLRLRGI